MVTKRRKHMKRPYKKQYIQRRQYNKYNNRVCEDNLTFEECELTILRNAIDENEQQKKKETMQNTEEIQKIIDLLEQFIIKKKCICYGGIAINNILPPDEQFYDKNTEIPDYDFFTPNAMEDAKELADMYYKKGYEDVEAKSGMHYGTFKVYVNFIHIADITQIHENIYRHVLKDSIVISGIHYIPLHFIRMSIYLELSRPMGDMTRWEKIYKRLLLINKYFPFETELSCDANFQRKMSSNKMDEEKIFEIIKHVFIQQNVVFFGGYAFSLYQKKETKIPDFDVLSENAEKCSLILCEKLREFGFKKVEEIYHEPIGELIPERFEIRINDETVAFIYYPIACHNYNTIHIQKKKINVATIDTILSFYLAFIYTDEYDYYKNRLLCMAKYLFFLEEKTKLLQYGLLKRFNMKCIGKQPTMEEIRMEKSNKYRELKQGTREYDLWFLKYNPALQNKKNKNTQKSRKKKHAETFSMKPSSSSITKKNKRIELGYLF